MLKKLLIMALTLAPVSTFAQKFAQFDLQSVVQALPAYKTATTELQALGQQYQKNLEDMQHEFENKAQKYHNEEAAAAKAGKPVPQVILKRQNDELQGMYDKIRQANEDNQKAFQQAQADKMRPITEQVLNAVAAVAKEGNYVYIMDKNAAQSNSIYINPTLSEDVTAKVKAKLAIK